MAKGFERLGLMSDMSRNAVMSIDALKRFLPLLAKMGYNSVMLYTEDTYEVEGHPYFGYMRGRYSVAEMQELDAFAADLGIEMIPCIQTLAHLKQAFKWDSIPKDLHDVLLTDDETVYQLIDDMFATTAKSFRSWLIHIGMDEAAMLGRGKHLDEHGYESTYSIMKRHLDKVIEIAEKYGYHVLLWADMLFNSGYGAWGFSGDSEFSQEVVDSFPRNVTLVYWDYSPNKAEHFDQMIAKHKKLADDVWFAGGLYSWYGMIPLNGLSNRSTKETLTACKKLYFLSFPVHRGGPLA